MWHVCVGEIEDNQGKGVIIQLDLKDREYTLRALTMKEAQKWVDVLTQLRDAGIALEKAEEAAGKSPGKSKKAGASAGVKQVEIRSVNSSGESVSSSVKDMSGPAEKKWYSCCIR